jgi:uncharacterized protein (DUF4415 family)
MPKLSSSNEGWREARRKALRQLADMTDEEAAEITAGALSDPDNPPWPDDKLSRMRPAVEVMPEVVEAFRRRRGPQKAPTKESISLRLDRDVIAHFRKRGPGWQRSINDTLRQAARLGPKPGASKARAPKARASSITKSSPARRRPRRGR